MRRKSLAPKSGDKQVVRDIRRQTRKHHSTEEKIRIVLSGLRGEDSITELCRREGLFESRHPLSLVDARKCQGAWPLGQ